MFKQGEKRVRRSGIPVRVSQPGRNQAKSNAGPAPWEGRKIPFKKAPKILVGPDGSKIKIEANAKTSAGNMLEDGSHISVDYANARQDPSDRVGAVGESRLFAPLPSTRASLSQDAKVGTQYHDVHNHSHGEGYSFSQVLDPSKTMAENIENGTPNFDEAGADLCIIAPIPTNIISGGAGDSMACGNDGHCHPVIDGKTYYLPQDVRTGGKPMDISALDRAAAVAQYPTTHVDWQTAVAVKDLIAGKEEKEHILERYIPSITGINLGDANAVHQIMMLMNQFPHTFGAIGEVTMHKEVVEEQNRSYKVDWSEDAPINAIFQFAGRAHLPVILHCDVNSAREAIAAGARGNGAYFNDLTALFKRHKETQFVWAHMGGIGKYAPPGDNHPEELEKVLTECPNVCIDMSWDVVAREFHPKPGPAYNANSETRARFEQGHPAYNETMASDAARREGLLKRMAGVIEKFPDRFIYGSDSLIARQPGSISDTYAYYSNFGPGSARGKKGLFDYLSNATVENILRNNFERVFVENRPLIYEYEDGCLKGDLHRLAEQVKNNGSVPNVWR